MVPPANNGRSRHGAAQKLRSRLPASQPNDHVAIYHLLRIMTDQTISTLSHRPSADPSSSNAHYLKILRVALPSAHFRLPLLARCTLPTLLVNRHATIGASTR
jgi:hypothetical protein